MSCRLFFGIPLALLALTGCDRPTATDPARPGSPAPAGPYYDVRQQLDSLVRALDARHAATEKTVSLRDGEPETKRVAGLKWADELQLFYQADINKAALRGAYDVKIGRDVASGPGMATQYEYTRKPNAHNASVVQLRVLCYPGRRLRHLEATIEQENALFTSQKHLNLHCADGPDGGISYEVQGSQKLILFDSLRFATKARVQ